MYDFFDRLMKTFVNIQH